ncbi:MAG TPA: HWE histidine kinase domain-containing protein [Xanthobacteraceae bacterium]|nr:HWE histidine kinase domain-containing protein [Xanthobacteraceae bacterium]
MDPAAIDHPIFPLLDLVPANKQQILGIDATADSVRLSAIIRARDRHAVQVAGSVISMSGIDFLVLYAPIYDADEKFSGVLEFDYDLKKLLHNVVTTTKADRDFDVYVSGDHAAHALGIALDGSFVNASPLEGTSLVARKTADFGGHRLDVRYVFHRDLQKESWLRGFRFMFGGFLLTACMTSMLAFAASRASNLAQEVDSRRAAEERLKGLIHELNHRVRNIMAVAQSIVRLSFTPGQDLADVKLVCEGRLQALSSAMTLLTDSDWTSVSLRSLTSGAHLPFADRILVEGPDLALKPKAAQTFALLLYELAVNAAKHGALSNVTGQVSLKWALDMSAAEPMFRLSWSEHGGPPVLPPARRGFGELLVRRIAPRDVAGRGRVSYDADGFSYELEAPLHEIVGAEGIPKN